MNALNRNIESGEVVVLSDSYIGMPTARERAFVCLGGQGVYRDTPKDKIYGHWFDGTGYDFVKGSYIDPEATAVFQQEINHERISATPHRRIELARAEDGASDEVHDQPRPMATRE